MRNYLLPLAVLAMIAAGCAKEETAPEEPAAEEEIVAVADTGAYVPGVAEVYVSEDMAGLIEADIESGKVVTKSMALNSVLDELGIVSIRRLFPNTGRFEERRRKAGLHRWYVIEYDKNAPRTKAALELESVPGFENIEFRRKIRITDFNDPRLGDQWHYYNDGSISGYKEGVDINVKPVWVNYLAGSSDVIVSVVDGGIDQGHADLKDNLIPGGKNGSRNFVDNNFTIVAHEHGTHVGGTIGAVNNNGMGVCGIAGGDASASVPGVKLLSCQIFKSVDGKDTQGSGAEAIVWGADHGAVISQNSWGYYADADQDGTISPQEKEDYYKMKIPDALKAAVDYFVENAGMDEDGNQEGPMAGGIVIFAAGNESLDYEPICDYDKVMAVGSVDGAGQRSSFSNYGDWVDIAAPGSNVYSTLPAGRYGYMSGTSMACPHVSGVAALVVANCGGMGFTASQLWNKLVKGGNKTILSKNSHIGPLVDALGAITYGVVDPPATVSSYTAKGRSNNIDFTWNVTRGSYRAAGYLLMASTDRSALEKVNPKNPETGIKTFYYTVPENVKYKDQVTASISGLEFATKYYVTLAGCDYSANYSKISEIKEVKTEANNPPVIKMDQTAIVLHAYQTVTIPVTVSEPDGHAFTVEIDGGSDAAVLSNGLSEGAYTVTITGTKAKAGTYTLVVKATDAFGMSSSKSVKYQILENQAPDLLKDIDDILTYNVGDKITVDASKYFNDADGEQLTYSFDVSDMNVAHISATSSNTFIVSTLGYGLATIVVKAVDALGETVTCEFKILVRNSDVKVEAFPNPVRDVLNIRTGEDPAQTSVKIVSSTGSVIYESTSTFSAFEPLSVDMGTTAPGRYTLYVSYGDVKYDQTIVKL